MSSSACGFQVDKKAQMIATGARETGPCDHRHKFKGANAVSSHCFEMNTVVSAFLLIKVSSVSLQSEEFHIYTQYCTNYPRYDTHYECAGALLFTVMLFQVGRFNLCWYEALCADCCGETRKRAENNYRGAQVLNHSGFEAPVTASGGENLERP